MLLWRWHNPDAPITGIGYLALVAMLSGCASETPWRTPITSASPVTAADNTTECSLVGRLACRSMAFISNDGSGSQQGTCTASRAGGTYIETCGTASASTTVAAPGATPPKPQASPAPARAAPRSSVQLSWKDNSNNETGFVIERCDQVLRDISSSKMTPTCRGSWKTVANVAANTTSYVDDTVTANQTYIYRVKATNASGSSAYTPEAVITAPVK